MTYGQFGVPQVQITFAGMSWTGGMPAGVSTITAIDSSFHGDEFLTFAQGAFLRVMEARATKKLDDVRPLLSQNMCQTFAAEKAKAPAIANVEHATIFNAQRDAHWDSVTVRIGAKTTARRKNDLVEDWTFQRPAVSGLQQLPTECPSCGAPLDLDDNGSCRYCRVPVAGARGGWKLVRAMPPPAAPKVSSGGFSWVAAFIILMVVGPIVLTVGILAFVFNSTSNLVGNVGGSSSSNGTKVTKSATPSTAKATATTERIGTPATPAAPKTSGTVTGTATLAGAVTGDVDGRVVLTGGSASSCASRGDGVTGLVFAVTAIGDSGTQSLSLTMNLPAGVSGPGDFELTTTPMALAVAYSQQAGVDGSKAQSWTVGPATTATFRLAVDGSGSLTVAGLAPSAPFPADDSLGEPFAYVLNFTCG